MKKLTTEQFISGSHVEHSNKFDYSKTIYINGQTKVEIICPIHGSFFQLPNNHKIHKQGCPDCGRLSRNKSQAKSNSDFIKEATIKHNGFFNYSKSKYINYIEKVEIICPIHNSFWQGAGSHLNGCGCPECSGLKKLTTDEFILRSKLLHPDKFTYENTLYVNAHSNVIITCKIHGDFSQEPTNHLCGKGCQECAGNKLSNTHIFIEKANPVHKNRYNYSLTNYISSSEKVTIICPKHGEFDQFPSQHLQGSGCTKCTHIISKPETQFLDYCHIPLRNHRLPEWNNKPVDGFDPKTNTIYEFLGDYWHGNPLKYNSIDIHPKRKIPYVKICENTMNGLNKLKSLGYNVKYIWESDWNNFKKKITTEPNIVTL